MKEIQDQKIEPPFEITKCEKRKSSKESSEKSKSDQPIVKAFKSYAPSSTDDNRIWIDVKLNSSVIQPKPRKPTVDSKSVPVNSMNATKIQIPTPSMPVASQVPLNPFVNHPLLSGLLQMNKSQAQFNHMLSNQTQMNQISTILQSLMQGQYSVPPVNTIASFLQNSMAKKPE